MSENTKIGVKDLSWELGAESKYLLSWIPNRTGIGEATFSVEEQNERLKSIFDELKKYNIGCKNTGSTHMYDIAGTSQPVMIIIKGKNDVLKFADIYPDLFKEIQDNKMKQESAKTR